MKLSDIKNRSTGELLCIIGVTILSIPIFLLFLVFLPFLFIPIVATIYYFFGPIKPHRGPKRSEKVKGNEKKDGEGKLRRELEIFHSLSHNIMLFNQLFEYKL